MSFTSIYNLQVIYLFLPTLLNHWSLTPAPGCLGRAAHRGPLGAESLDAEGGAGGCPQFLGIFHGENMGKSPENGNIVMLNDKRYRYDIMENMGKC